jgi:hypothetical protein
MPRSPAIDLSTAAIKFARSRTAASATTTADHAMALVDCLVMFVVHCPHELAPAARVKLGTFFEISVGDLIDSHVMGWIGETVKRAFVLDCAKQLGTATSAIGREGAVVTGEMLDRAAESVIGRWQAESFPILGACGACMALREFIRNKLEHL